MAGKKTGNQIYEVGIYCRLSKDDGTENESASIATQKSILTDYVKKQGWHLAKTYVDDGYSGTNFQRPSFQNMIKDIENGLINCVITKDLSRLGRNYLDCGLYLEVFFPEHDVRYIAVNDGVDTLNKSAMDITPFRNILNEMYAADISVKIKSAYRARFQQGKFMGTYAPYGYIKDPADHNHLLIDENVAHIVREMFDLALAGNGIAKICKYINKHHILCPAAYAAERGETAFERHIGDNVDSRYIWCENSVRNILRSPIYAGNLVGYKRVAVSMKSKKRPSKLPEDWEVIPNTHEGIVTQEEFDTVQQLMTSRRRERNAGGFENIFAGVIKCADCGFALRTMSANRRKRPDVIDCVQYSCNNYAKNGKNVCTSHNVEARDLFNAVLADINHFADMAVNDERAVRAIEKRLTETDQSKAKAMEKERKKLNKRLAELDRLFYALYEDKVMERITERNFEMMSGKYQKEQLEIEAKLKEVTETLNESYEKSQGIRDFLSLIRNYQGLKELDATVVNALIDKILVSEREKMADGTIRQEIKIYYKFIGFVGELHITPTKRWTALAAKHCTVCGVEYVPGSGVSKFCPKCREKVRKAQRIETDRRSRERKRKVCIELSAKNDRLISVFVVHTIERESMVIGTLYALGVKRKTLLLSYLFLPAVITLAAGTAGTVLGYSGLGVNVQLQNTYDYFSIPYVHTVYTPYLAVYGVVMPPAVAVLINWLVIYKNLKKPALALMRREQKTESYGRKSNKVKSTVFRQLGFVRTFQIRQLLRERRTAFTVSAGMFLALLVCMIGLDCYVFCMHIKTDSVADTRYKYMYTFKYPQETVPAGGEEACGMTLKKEVLGYYMDVTLLGINPQNPYFDAPVSKGQSHVLISSAAASKCVLKTGDNLVLNDKRNDKSYAFTVDGIVPYAAGMFVFMDIDSMRELIGEKEDYYNIVFAGHALDIDSGRLYAVSSKAEVEKSADIFVEKMWPMIRMVVIGSALIFFVVMYLMLKVMIDCCAASISMMKIFGYRKKEINRLYLNGNLVIVAVSAAAGIPLSKAAMDAAYPYLTANVAAGLNLAFDWRLYAGLFVSILALYSAITPFLIMRINRILPAEALKNKE